MERERISNKKYGISNKKQEIRKGKRKDGKIGGHQIKNPALGGVRIPVAEHLNLFSIKLNFP
ncbi:MAG: hypothetical protein ACM3P1_10640 [Candidatus Saccharibacteria bacterium]